MISNFAVSLRTKSTLDDTLDVFPCHGIGGMVGMLATGIFCDKGLLEYGFKSPAEGQMPIFLAHLIALVVVSAFAFFGSLILYKITDLIIPLRVTPRAGRARPRPQPARRDGPRRRPALRGRRPR